MEKMVFKRDSFETIMVNQPCPQKGAKCGLSYPGFTTGTTPDIRENPGAGVGFGPSVHTGPATTGRVPSEPSHQSLSPWQSRSQAVTTGSNGVGSALPLRVPVPKK